VSESSHFIRPSEGEQLTGGGDHLTDGPVVALERPAGQSGSQPGISQTSAICPAPKSRKELQDELGLGDAEHFRKAYLLPAPESGLVERIIPDKPQSSKQRYRLGDKGRQWLAQQKALGS